MRIYPGLSPPLVETEGEGRVLLKSEGDRIRRSNVRLIKTKVKLRILLSRTGSALRFRDQHGPGEMRQEALWPRWRKNILETVHTSAASFFAHIFIFQKSRCNRNQQTHTWDGMQKYSL